MSISRSGNRGLSPRAAFRRAFGGMAVFVALPLLGFGGYLIQDQFQNPVTSQPAGLIFAAVLIAAALYLLSYVIYPGVTRRREADLALFAEPVRTKRTIDITVSVPLAVHSESCDLPGGDYRTAVPGNSPVALRREEWQGSSAPPESSGDVIRARPR